jgi:hypothetical protein
MIESYEDNSDDESNEIESQTEVNSKEISNIIEIAKSEKSKFNWPKSLYNNLFPLDVNSFENILNEVNTLFIKCITWNLCAKPPPNIDILSYSKLFSKVR